MKKENEKRRSFGGKIDNFENDVERNFEKKHLRAYLKGFQLFKFGLNAITKRPNMVAVKEVWS